MTCFSKISPVFSGILWGLSTFSFSLPLYAEWSGYFGAETRLFARPALFSEQRDQAASLLAEPEYHYQGEAGKSFTFKPFLRLDSADEERTHADIREFVGLWLLSGLELRAGISKVFWGVTESQHLIDIVNQTDLVEYVDGEDKLGQPMLFLSAPKEWGTVDILILPYFRERTFAGKQGRLRNGFIVDTDHPVYESSAEEYHVDLAARYSHSVNGVDLSVSYFRGTGRDPSFLPKITPQGEILLTPYYEQIQQYGLSMQWVKESWLLKLEAIQRQDQQNRLGLDEDYWALTTGFEYTLGNFKNSNIDVGLVSEWLYDSRSKTATTPFQNDIFLGLRLGFNDTASTEFLAGVIQDLHKTARTFSVEASRRFGESWKVELNAFLVSHQDPQELLYDLREDEMVQLNLLYYF